MQKINKEFDVPYYIFEEIIEYVSNKDRNQIAKKNNIEALLKLAVVNNRITNEQANYIKNIIENI